MPEVLDAVYKPLRLSFEFLGNERAKSLFLLCCLFPEDDNIPLDELTFYALGLDILKGIDKLEQARNRVCSLVEMLKSRFLLLEGYHEYHVRMHDVVRDVAVFIASDKKWITTQSNDGTWFSPYIGGRTGLHVGSRVSPNRHLLWIDCLRGEELNSNSYFFEGMKELNVLSIKHLRVPWLPKTTRLLENLQTLVLEWCDCLESISTVGKLVNLKILICRSCYSIESLPMEIGRLSSLKLLELSECTELTTIAPGIISKLKELEELIVWECFDGWEAKNMGKESKNALLSELEHLSSLSRLKIAIKDSRLAAEQIRLSPNLKEYHIRIGDRLEDFRWRFWPMKLMRFDREMELQLPENISPGEWIRELVRNVEYMHIEGDGSSDLDFGVAHNMRVLVFKNCSTAKTLVSTKTTATVFPLLEVLHLEKLIALKEIRDIDGPMSSNSFSNLQVLSLKDIPALERLDIVSTFNKLQQLSLVHLPALEHLNVSTSSKLSSIQVYDCNKLSSMMIKGSSLIQVKRLEIESCEMLEQILLWDEEEEDQRVFQNLKFLKLEKLPNLTSFTKGIKSIRFPVLEDMKIVSCARLKSLVCTNSPDDDDDGDDDCISIFCKSQKFEFSSLKKLEVGGYIDSMCRNWCPMMTGIFTTLSKFDVSEIDDMKSLFPYSMAQNLHNLRSLCICECNDMVRVIEDDACGGETLPTPTRLLPNLERIELWYLKKLKSFCECKHALEFPSLTRLEIAECELMEEFTSGPLHTPILEDISINLVKVNSTDVNELLQQRRHKREEGHHSRLEGNLVEQKVEDIPIEMTMVQNVEERHLESMVEESRKRHVGLSIGIKNEFQPEKRRRIETEEEHNRGLERSSLLEQMQARIEIMEEDSSDDD